MNYYNEINPEAASWLRELIKAGAIPAGEVDERSIEDVTPNDLAGFRQCHFFAGIGGWSLALRLAGWPEDRQIWTGSCPCQPFSAAGEGAGFADERHLWPAFFHLIDVCRPSVVAGEQVASKAADPWVDLVCTDLEALGYAFGAVPFPAAGIGSPHIRDRLYWLANADHAGLEGRRQSECGRTFELAPWSGGLAGGMAHSGGNGREVAVFQRTPGIEETGVWKADEQRGVGASDDAGPVNGFWRDADWLGCRDGKWRPVEPGTFPLGNGISGRVGRLRGYGNAIVPQAAEAFIRSFM